MQCRIQFERNFKKKAINAELVMLIISEIWQEEVSLKKINIVTSK